MNESKFALKYGLGAGFLSVLCCVGPIIPILLGVGGGAALFGLDQYKPWFIGLGLLVLAGASWYAVNKQNACCAVRNRAKNAKLFAMIFAIGMLTYGAMFYGVVPLLARVAGDKVEARQTALATGKISPFQASVLDLQVEGMTCAGCSVGVKQALLQVPGVITADVDWQSGAARIEFDRNQTDIDAILRAKVQEQYSLTVANNNAEQGIPIAK